LGHSVEQNYVTVTLCIVVIFSDKCFMSYFSNVSAPKFLKVISGQLYLHQLLLASVKMPARYENEFIK